MHPTHATLTVTIAPHALLTLAVILVAHVLLAILIWHVPNIMAAYKRRKARKALIAAKLTEIKALWYYTTPCTDESLSGWLASYTKGERGSAPRHDELYKLIMQYFLMHNRHINTTK